MNAKQLFTSVRFLMSIGVLATALLAGIGWAATRESWQFGLLMLLGLPLLVGVSFGLTLTTNWQRFKSAGYRW